LLVRLSRFWWLLVILGSVVGLLYWFRIFSGVESALAFRLLYLLLFWTGVALAMIRAKRSGYTLWACWALAVFGTAKGFGSVLSIVFGSIALLKIKQNPQLKGKGLAIASILVGIVMLTFVVMEFVSPNFMTLASQVEPSCAAICQKEAGTDTYLVENNPDNYSEYFCSCLDNTESILVQYMFPVRFS
jgi:hypothetical protein